MNPDFDPDYDSNPEDAEWNEQADDNTVAPRLAETPSKVMSFFDFFEQYDSKSAATREDAIILLHTALIGCTVDSETIEKNALTFSDTCARGLRRARTSESVRLLSLINAYAVNCGPNSVVAETLVGAARALAESSLRAGASDVAAAALQSMAVVSFFCGEGNTLIEDVRSFITDLLKSSHKPPLSDPVATAALRSWSICTSCLPADRDADTIAPMMERFLDLAVDSRASSSCVLAALRAVALAVEMYCGSDISSVGLLPEDYDEDSVRAAAAGVGGGRKSHLLARKEALGAYKTIFNGDSAPVMRLQTSKQKSTVVLNTWVLRTRYLACKLCCLGGLGNHLARNPMLGDVLEFDQVIETEEKNDAGKGGKKKEIEERIESRKMRQANRKVAEREREAKLAETKKGSRKIAYYDY